jgi:hypothetical protein
MFQGIGSEAGEGKEGGKSMRKRKRRKSVTGSFATCMDWDLAGR